MNEPLLVLGVVELDSVAMGLRVLDTMVKAAPVTVVDARTLCPGKYLIMVTGDVASVESSVRKGLAEGRECLLDSLLIKNLHPDVAQALRGEVSCSDWDAIAVLESFSVTGGIEAADACGKAAGVRVVRIRIGDEMGGKCSTTILGPLSEIEAAVERGVSLLSEKGVLCRHVVIPRPESSIRSHAF